MRDVDPLRPKLPRQGLGKGAEGELPYGKVCKVCRPLDACCSAGEDQGWWVFEVLCFLQEGEGAFREVECSEST